MYAHILQALYQSQLDGEFESVQPSLKVPVSYFTRWDGFEDGDEEMLQQQLGQEVQTITCLIGGLHDTHAIAQLHFVVAFRHPTHSWLFQVDFA